MRVALTLLAAGLLAGACGCDGSGSGGAGTSPEAGERPGRVEIRYEIMPSILFEAEAGEIEAPVALFEKSDCSNGQYVLAPEGPEHKEISIGGEVTYRIRADEPGMYTLWLRTRFSGACGNSLDVLLDGAPMGTVEDGVFEAWHWTPLRARRLRLDDGPHLLTIVNREDGSAWDQVLLTQDKDYRPDGVERSDVKGRSGGLLFPETTLDAPSDAETEGETTEDKTTEDGA